MIEILIDKSVQLKNEHRLAWDEICIIHRMLPSDLTTELNKKYHDQVEIIKRTHYQIQVLEEIKELLNNLDKRFV